MKRTSHGQMLKAFVLVGIFLINFSLPVLSAPKGKKAPPAPATNPKNDQITVPVQGPHKGKTEPAKPTIDQTYDQLKLLLDVYQQVTQNYVEDVDTQKLIYGAASGLVEHWIPLVNLWSQKLARRCRQPPKANLAVWEYGS